MAVTAADKDVRHDGAARAAASGSRLTGVTNPAVLRGSCARAARPYLSPMNANPLHLGCPHCGATNRLPAARIGDVAVEYIYYDDASDARNGCEDSRWN